MRAFQQKFAFQLSRHFVKKNIFLSMSHPLKSCKLIPFLLMKLPSSLTKTPISYTELLYKISVLYSILYCIGLATNLVIFYEKKKFARALAYSHYTRGSCTTAFVEYVQRKQPFYINLLHVMINSRIYD